MVNCGLINTLWRAVAAALLVIVLAILPAQSFAQSKVKIDAVINILDDHGHNHDDDVDKTQIGFDHGHDPADHSHQLACLSGAEMFARQNRLRNWHADASLRVRLIRYDIERPPKPSASVMST